MVKAVCIIAVGANDVYQGTNPDNFRETVKSAVLKVQAEGKIVLVMGLPDYSAANVQDDREKYGINETSAQLKARIYQYNAILKQIAKETGSEYSSAMAWPVTKKNSEDQLHFNELAQIAIAEEMYMNHPCVREAKTIVVFGDSYSVGTGLGRARDTASNTQKPWPSQLQHCIFKRTGSLRVPRQSSSGLRKKGHNYHPGRSLAKAWPQVSLFGGNGKTAKQVLASKNM